MQKWVGRMGKIRQRCIWSQQTGVPTTKELPVTEKHVDIIICSRV